MVNLCFFKVLKGDGEQTILIHVNVLPLFIFLFTAEFVV